MMNGSVPSQQQQSPVIIDASPAGASSSPRSAEQVDAAPNTATPGNVSGQNKKPSSFGGLLVRFGTSLLRALESVGETVADVLGLDEPKFQYVVDSMTEQELEEARRVNELRNAEYETFTSNQEAGAMECGESHPIASPTSLPQTSPSATTSSLAVEGTNEAASETVTNPQEKELNAGVAQVPGESSELSSSAVVSPDAGAASGDAAATPPPPLPAASDSASS